MWTIFESEYLRRAGVRCALIEHETDGPLLTASVVLDGVERRIVGTGNGPIAGFVAALSGAGVDVRVLDYHEHAMSSGSDAYAASYVECAVGGETYWGAGIDANSVTASLQAVVSAVNRAARRPAAG